MASSGQLLLLLMLSSLVSSSIGNRDYRSSRGGTRYNPSSRGGTSVGTQYNPSSRRGYSVGTQYNPSSRRGYSVGTQYNPSSRGGTSVGTQYNPSSRRGSSVGTQYNPSSRGGTRYNPSSQGGSSVGTRGDSSVRSLPDSSSSISDRQIQGPEWSRQKINKPKEALKAVGRYALGMGLTTLSYAVPFLGLIPVHGTLIAASANLALLPLNMLDKRNSDKQLLRAITFEFENLNLQLQQNHKELKYDIWASSTYSKPEKYISLAWEKYQTTVNALMQSTTEAEKDRHVNEFMNSYQKYEPAIIELHRLLTVKGASFTYSLGDLLAQHLKCHEKDLREYTEFINKLICKGIMMNQFYYKVKKIESKARVDRETEIAYESANVMFRIHKQCIFDSIKYVTEDVQDLINSHQHRSDLADDIRKFLDKTYDRYDWLAVAFITKNSQHRIVETLNKHVLAGFTEVRKGDITVAVARQVKGTHTKASSVIQTIQECIPENTLCYKVREKLENCPKDVNLGSGVSKPVKATYSAVHAYISKPHDTQHVFQVSSPQTPYIHKGLCEKSPGVKNGKYVVLIKSDEELLSKDPCAKLTCGGRQRGQCVRMPDLFLAMCVCRHPFYGKDCENSLEDYKKELQREAGSIVLVNTRSTGSGF